MQGMVVKKINFGFTGTYIQWIGASFGPSSIGGYNQGINPNMNQPYGQPNQYNQPGYNPNMNQPYVQPNQYNQPNPNMNQPY